MRTRTKDKYLPPCVYLKHGRYWLVKKGKWADLGVDLSTALAEYARRLEAPTGGMPALVDAVLKHVSTNLSQNTRKQYALAAKRLKSIFAEFSPEQVKAKHVAEVKASLKSTPNMANRVLSFLRQVFDYALERQLVEDNPAASIKQYREKKRNRLITREEYDAVYAKGGPRLRVIMDLLYLTGQRISDVLKIRHSDLQTEGILVIQQKTDARLVVRWSPELRAVVEQAKALHGKVREVAFDGKSPPLLPAKQGKLPNYRTIKDQWDSARKEAEIEDITLHDIRAMSLTATNKQGKDATALAGHATKAQTDRYLRDHETPIVEGPSIRQLIPEQKNG